MKKFTFLLLEILIGLSLVSLLLFLGINKYRDHLKLTPAYTVQFNDIDGLSIGSPVKFMGIQIGNVTKLEMYDSEIYVTFRNTHKDLKIPEGSMATVTFTGLAGAKSLEIVPPSENTVKDGQMFVPLEPVRINSVFEVQNFIIENVIQYTKGLLKVMTKGGNTSGQENIKAGPDLPAEAIAKSPVKFNETIIKNTEKLSEVKKSFDQLAKDETVKKNIHNIKTNVETISKSVDIKKASENISNLSENMDNLNTSLEKFSVEVKKTKEREAGYIKDMNASLKKASNSLLNFIESVNKTFRSTEGSES